MPGQMPLARRGYHWSLLRPILDFLICNEVAQFDAQTFPNVARVESVMVLFLARFEMLVKV